MRQDNPAHRHTERKQRDVNLPEVRQTINIRGEEMTEWISVEDRLPDRDTIGKKYLIWFIPLSENSTPSIAFGYWQGGWWIVPSATVGIDEYKITHWMPLPDPPEVKK